MSCVLFIVCVINIYTYTYIYVSLSLSLSLSLYIYIYIYRLPRGHLVVKNLPANAGELRDAGLISGLERFPWRKAWQPTPIFLPGESHGQRSLAAGYSP